MLMRVAAGAALCVIAGAAVAEQPLYELDVEFGHTWREGNAVNAGSDVTGEISEIPEYFSGALSLSAARKLDTGLTVQGGLRYERSFADDKGTDRDPGDPAPDAEDTYRAGALATMQVGRVLGNTYWGGYGLIGTVGFIEPEDDQDAVFISMGAQAEYRAEDWSLGGSLGYMASSADDEEGADETWLLSGQGTHYFQNGGLRLTGRLTYLDGYIDNDSSLANRDELDMIEASLQLEKQLASAGGHDWSGYAGVHWLGIKETDNDGDVDRASDAYLSVGLRVRFGGAGLKARDRYQAPDLPNYLRILQAGPVVD